MAEHSVSDSSERFDWLGFFVLALTLAGIIGAFALLGPA